MLKKITLTSLSVAGVSAAALIGSEPARAALVYDNIGAPVAGAVALPIGSFAVADDFTLAQAVNLTGFAFWAAGQTQNSDLSDSIGWAIFNNNAGAVGSLIASGTDTSVTKTNVVGTNIFKVDGDFGGTISLAAGIYWISFRDGAWGSAFDGTEAGWTIVEPSTVGARLRFDSNEVNPTFSSPFDASANFQLFDNSTPPPGTPEPGTLVGLLAVGVAGAFSRARRE